MANEKKMTKAEKFEKLLEVVDYTFEDGTTADEFFNNELEILKKRKERSADKPRKKDVVSETLRKSILEVLENAEAPMTASEIATAIGTDTEGHPVTYNRVSALIRGVEDGKVVKTYEGKTAKFALA